MKIVGDFADGGLIFRYQDPDNYRAIFQGRNKIWLTRGVEMLEQVDHPQIQNKYVTYKVVAQNDNVTVLVNDKEVVDYEASTIPDAGRIGLLINIKVQGANTNNFPLTVHFDNFQVESDEIKAAVDAAGKLSVTWSQLKSQY